MKKKFDKEVKFWKIAALTLPFFALIMLLITEFIDTNRHSEIYCITLIFLAVSSVTFWAWTVWQMLKVIKYLSVAEENYNEMKKELKETKQLLKTERENVRNWKR